MLKKNYSEEYKYEAVNNLDNPYSDSNDKKDYSDIGNYHTIQKV